MHQRSLLTSKSSQNFFSSWKYFIFYFILWQDWIQLNLSACPNLCNGHGTCNSETNTCECEELYLYAADCSLRK